MNHYVSFTDGDIATAFERVTIEHTDAPSEAELCQVRESLCIGSEVVSLHWLRNRIVQLRKGGKLKRSNEPDLFS